MDALVSAAVLPPPTIEAAPRQRGVAADPPSERPSPPIPPSPTRGEPRSPTSEMVSLRLIKAAAETFGPSHPLRILLMGEPDEVPAAEYALKLPGWFRLMRAHRP